MIRPAGTAQVPARNQGYKVAKAINGLGGIRLTRRAPFDAVVLDFHIPHIDREQVREFCAASSRNLR